MLIGNLVETRNGGMKNDDGGGKKKRNGGPQLQVVISNVVSREEVNRGDFEMQGE